MTNTPPLEEIRLTRLLQEIRTRQQNCEGYEKAHRGENEAAAEYHRGAKEAFELVVSRLERLANRGLTAKEAQQEELRRFPELRKIAEQRFPEIGVADTVSGIHIGEIVAKTPEGALQAASECLGILHPIEGLPSSLQVGDHVRIEYGKGEIALVHAVPDRTKNRAISR
jgi:hypothetical protein